jgi:large subunit ribosomal protein L20
MSRVRRGVIQHARHKRVIAKAKGYYGRRKNVFRVAKQAVERALQYQTRDRKNRKRTFRALWIQRINAAVREIDPNLNYATFMNGVAISGVDVDRKVLSDLAISEPDAFKAVVDMAKEALAQKAANQPQHTK